MEVRVQLTTICNQNNSDRNKHPIANPYKKANKSFVRSWHFFIKFELCWDLMFGDIWRFFLCTAEKSGSQAKSVGRTNDEIFICVTSRFWWWKYDYWFVNAFYAWIGFYYVDWAVGVAAEGLAAQSASAASRRISASSINPRTDFLLPPIDMQNSEALAAHLISALHCHSEFLSRREWKYFCGSRAGANQRENN